MKIEQLTALHDYLAKNGIDMSNFDYDRINEPEPVLSTFKGRTEEIKAKYNHVFKRALYILILLPFLSIAQPPPPGMNAREMDSLKRVEKAKKDSIHIEARKGKRNYKFKKK